MKELNRYQFSHAFPKYERMVNRFHKYLAENKIFTPNNSVFQVGHQIFEAFENKLYALAICVSTFISF